MRVLLHTAECVRDLCFASPEFTKRLRYSHAFNTTTQQLTTTTTHTHKIRSANFSNILFQA